MTRYECIKNLTLDSSAHGFTEGSEPVIDFKAGKVYIGADPDDRSQDGKIMIHYDRTGDNPPAFLSPEHVTDHFKPIFKRYQCIKDMSDGSKIVFKAGKLYDVVEVVDILEVIDENSNHWILDLDIMEHFQKLPEPYLIEDPYADNEGQEYVWFQTPPTLTKVCVIGTAITIALIATGLYFAFLY